MIKCFFLYVVVESIFTEKFGKQHKWMINYVIMIGGETQLNRFVYLFLISNFSTVMGKNDSIRVRRQFVHAYRVTQMLMEIIWRNCYFDKRSILYQTFFFHKLACCLSRYVFLPLYFVFIQLQNIRWNKKENHRHNKKNQKTKCKYL